MRTREKAWVGPRLLNDMLPCKHLEQRTVGLDLTGGFMVNSQKMKFADL